MSSIHDQLLSEIDFARKLAAEFANRHGSNPDGLARGPREADRLVLEKAAAAEIAALAAEEERLSSLARERAEHRAKARAEKKASAEEIRPLPSTLAPEKVKSLWNAMPILKGLSKLHAKERAAAEELIRKAREVRDVGPSGTSVSGQGRSLEPPANPARGKWFPALGAAQVWYFTSEGERRGPVTFAELRTMAASRVLDPRLDKVWKKGMEGWKEAGLLDGLFERRAVPVEPASRRVVNQPRPVAALPKDLTAALASKYMCWPGVGRLALWLGVLLFLVLWSRLLSWSSPYLVAWFGSVMMSKVLPWAALVPIPVLLYLLLKRLVNVGMSRWWALVLAIPIVNLWVGFRCLICPSGYAYHRKLDRAGLVTLLVVAPTALFLSLKNPGLLSESRLYAGLHAVIEQAGKMVNPK